MARQQLSEQAHSIITSISTIVSAIKFLRYILPRLQFCARYKRMVVYQISVPLSFRSQLEIKKANIAAIVYYNGFFFAVILATPVIDAQ
jgi:hypothetical protein